MYAVFAPEHIKLDIFSLLKTSKGLLFTPYLCQPTGKSYNWNLRPYKLIQLNEKNRGAKSISRCFGAIERLKKFNRYRANFS